jgi:hypothetical protein
VCVRGYPIAPLSQPGSSQHRRCYAPAGSPLLSSPPARPPLSSKVQGKERKGRGKTKPHGPQNLDQNKKMRLLWLISRSMLGEREFARARESERARERGGGGGRELALARDFIKDRQELMLAFGRDTV